MELKIWTRTMLSVYRYLDRVCSAIDKLALAKALESAYVSSVNYGKSSCDKVSNQLINLTERKVNLINLKVITDEILKKIDRKYSKILILKHFDGLSAEQIGSLIGCSRRTVFRRAQESYTKFSEVLTDLGLTPEKLDLMFKEEGWIKDVYYSEKAFLECGGHETDSASEIVTKICTEFKKFSCGRI